MPASSASPPIEADVADDLAADEPPSPDDYSRTGALKIPAYRRFWNTLFLSMTGTWTRTTALGYLAYDLTDSELSLGLISLAASAPVMISSPIAGILLDRLDRRRVLLTIQLLNLFATLAVTVLVASGRAEFWHLLVISTVFGLSIGIDYPARLSVVPAMVPKSMLQSAVALNSVAYNSSGIFGPTVAGWLISGIGITACFAFATGAIVPFVIVCALLMLRPMLNPRTVSVARGTGFSELKDGYRYILATEELRRIFFVVVPPMILGMTYVTMAPAVARDVLDLDSRGLGLLLTANGLGALIGSFAVASSRRMKSPERVVLVGVVTFGIALMLFAASSNFWLSCLFIFGLGLTNSVYAVLNSAQVQIATGDEYRGRVTSAYSMLWGLTPIGGLQVGLLAEPLGLQRVLFLNGVLILLFAAWFWRRMAATTPTPAVSTGAGHT
jgi:MFS family permease